MAIRIEKKIVDYKVAREEPEQPEEAVEQPAAAAPDPGYYGREYSFEADAVVLD